MDDFIRTENTLTFNNAFTVQGRIKTTSVSVWDGIVSSDSPDGDIMFFQLNLTGGVNSYLQTNLCIPLPLKYIVQIVHDFYLQDMN